MMTQTERAARAARRVHARPSNGPLVRWYYTPMMLPFRASGRRSAPSTIAWTSWRISSSRRPNCCRSRRELLDTADVVFTGGYSLYEAKRDRHPNVHPFPSSVERAHFAQARDALAEPAGSGRHPRPPARLLRRDRRADGPRRCSPARRRAARLVDRHGRPGGQDRPGRPAAPAEHPLSRRQDYAELPGLSRRLGRGADAVRDQRVDALHQPDQDARISRRRQARWYRRRSPTSCATMASCDGVFIADDAERVHRRLRGGAGARPSAARPGLAQVDATLAAVGWDTTCARMAGLIAQARRQRDRVLRRRRRRAGRRVPSSYDYLVVGAGFAGSVMAERLATPARRARAGGRPAAAHRAATPTIDHDDAGVLIHQYGPHIFHTNSDEIFDYLSQFTAWRPYEHRVLAEVDGKLVPIPINRTTLNALYELEPADRRGSGGLPRRAAPSRSRRSRHRRTSSSPRSAASSTRLFFQGYTRKQWGIDPSRARQVGHRARPDPHQHRRPLFRRQASSACRRDGYTAMFERMLDHPNIEVLLGVDYARCARRGRGATRLIFTGPIDEYFDYRFGKLPYRSLRFEHETLDSERFPAGRGGQLPDPDVPYTRITEYKHLTGQSASADQHHLRIPVRRGRSLLPHAAGGEPGAVQAL